MTSWRQRHTSCAPVACVAIDLDVDVVDRNEIVLGLGLEPNGLTTSQVRRVIDDLSTTSDVVGLTIAEYIPRQVMKIRHFLDGMPLMPQSNSALTPGGLGSPRHG